ncbi:MAG: FAD-binding oxidoreductase, partial [Desulfurococcales archaeon]|nr:FAD-binding oxidoreductase [Desulfurococcales archaeon]
RNAGHFRVHFFSRENTVFAMQSKKRLLSLPKKTGYNPLVVQGGYFWLFHREETLKAYKIYNEKLWKPLGAPIKFFTPEEVRRRYPFLNTEGLIGAAMGPQDGSFHHDAVIYGYYSKLRAMGVKILEQSPVRRLIVENGRLVGAEVEGLGRIEASKTLVAAGGWSVKLLETAGVQIPLTPVLKEILVTEPYKYKFRELFILTDMAGYFTQTLKGELLGSIGLPDEPKGVVPMNNSLRWLTRFAKMMVSTLKGSENIRVLRLWSGYYAMTPDKGHILGRDPEWPTGLYVNTGYSGHGFMMAPYAGELLAKYMVEGKIHDHMKPFLPTRFKEGKLIKEGLVIG